jgi:hypothetical protein
LAHFTAKTFLFNSRNRFNVELMERLNLHLAQHALFLPVLKWCIINIFKTGQQDCLDFLPILELSYHQKSELIIFLTDLLRRENAIINKNEASIQYLHKDFSPILFEYFLGPEMFIESYKHALETLLKLNLTSNQKSRLYTILE